VVKVDGHASYSSAIADLKASGELAVIADAGRVLI
jgi:hypothetical protein